MCGFEARRGARRRYRRFRAAGVERHGLADALRRSADLAFDAFQVDRDRPGEAVQRPAQVERPFGRRGEQIGPELPERAILRSAPDRGRQILVQDVLRLWPPP